MADLHDLLHRAAPADDPTFDAADIRARVAAVDRRRRRTASAAMTAVVVLVVAVVATVSRLGTDADVAAPAPTPEVPALPDPIPQSPSAAPAPTPSATASADAAQAPSEPPSGAFPAADVVISALERTGRSVSDIQREGRHTTFSFRPTARDASPVWVRVTEEGGDPSWLTDAGTQLVQLGGGEGAVVQGGMIAFACGEVLLTTSGPGAGGSELGWVAELPDAMGCEPTPPGVSTPFTAEDGTTGTRHENIREARIAAVLDRLGVPGCCGEPSHGRTFASTGLVWEGSDVSLTVNPPSYRGNEELIRGQIIELGGGQADTGDGDGLPIVAFDCGDSSYVLTHDTTNTDVHIRAAAALVGELGCTPSVDA